MDRFILTNAQWELMAPLCLGKRTDPGRTGSDGRMFVEAVLWIVRTGSPWRDLPPAFGNWNTVAKRFRYWVLAYLSLFNAAIRTWKRHGGRDAMVLAQKPELRPSADRVSTKILALTDALGNLACCPVTVGLAMSAA